eukprot:1161220-Pelagomonas_calceolata.AAC.10
MHINHTEANATKPPDRLHVLRLPQLSHPQLLATTLTYLQCFTDRLYARIRQLIPLHAQLLDGVVVLQRICQCHGALLSQHLTEDRCLDSSSNSTMSSLIGTMMMPGEYPACCSPSVLHRGPLCRQRFQKMHDGSLSTSIVSVHLKQTN